jgi:murein DD-endopeptidase MepM/ murein hydrolase activator NlpD
MMTTYHIPQSRQGFDGIALVAFLLLIFGGLMVYRDLHSSNRDPAPGGGLEEHSPIIETNSSPGEVGSGRANLPNQGVDQRIFAPYGQYTLTQGPHGFSYGHMAIDISAGNGAEIKSPIQGYIADLYTDQYGNPTLMIENDFYRVTMLHGKYEVAVGEQISPGQIVGRESNLGLTTDMQGRSCRYRDCGYHTHLNIFDKRLNKNVNPLDVMQR